MGGRSPRELETLFGRVAVDLGLVTFEQLGTCLTLQETEYVEGETRRERKPIGVLLMERGFLSYESFLKVVSEQDRRMNKPVRHTLMSRRDLLFGQLAVRQGIVTADQLNRALRKQASMVELDRPVKRLGQILTEMEFMRPDQVLAILDIQNKRVLFCRMCAAQINVVGAKPDQKLRCPECGGESYPIAGGENLDAGSTHYADEL